MQQTTMKPARRPQFVRGGNFSPGIVAEQRPEIAMAIYRVISAWSAAESDLGRLLICTLQSNHRDAIEKLCGITATAKQQDHILSLARQGIPDAAHECLKIVLDIFTREHKQRNRLVHYIHGITGIPDSVVLANPRDWWRHQVHRVEFHEAIRGQRAKTTEEAIEFYRQMTRQPSPMNKVYYMSDFDRLLGRANEVRRCLFDVELLVGGNDQGYELLERSALFIEGRDIVRKRAKT